MRCIRARDSSCSGQVHVGLFYDGTGNNHFWTEPNQQHNQKIRNKHSNVSRLWDAHLQDVKSGFFKFYMQGVGTPYEEIGDRNPAITAKAGNGFGFMGAHRINWGIISAINAIHVYLTGEPAIIGDEMFDLVQQTSWELAMPTVQGEGHRRRKLLTKLEQKVQAAHAATRKKVIQVNISIFGFSRGAAQARACAHWISQLFEGEGGALVFGGIPVRIGFLGLFDTVASVGIGDITPVTFGHFAWANNTQSIAPAVEDSAHFIALHEQRASFPLESADTRVDVGYPGMHSDVGGGYCPGDQGKAMPSWGLSPHLSQIPLIDMHFAALKAGVPLLTLGEISKDIDLAPSFAVDSKLVKAFNGWREHNGIGKGNVKAVTKAHTNQYLAWRGLMHASAERALVNQPFYKRANATDKIDLLEADTNLGISLRAWEERRAANSTLGGRVGERSKDVMYYIMSPLQQLDPNQILETGLEPLSAVEKEFLKVMTVDLSVPQACVEMFDNYVHDSRAGFRPVADKHEPEWLTGGYARYRQVFLQTDEDFVFYSAINRSRETLKLAKREAVGYFGGLWGYTREQYAKTRRRISSEINQAAAGQRLLEARARHAVDEAAAGQRKIAASVSESIHQAAVGAVRTDQQIATNAAAAKSAVKQQVRKTSAQLKSDADKASRAYFQTQDEVVRHYIKAEDRWRAKLKEKWTGRPNPIRKK